MYYIEKRIEIAGSHCLDLDYESKCRNLHGHNWIVIVKCKSETLDHNGMIIDFTKIKELGNRLDHHNINDVVSFNPTAENLAKWFCDNIESCYEVSIQESEGNIAKYIKEDV